MLKNTYTFKGGTHVHEHKNTSGCGICKMPAPARVSIPMSQHIGAHCQPVVAVGDSVFYGQVIGEVTAGLGCPVHASVSGKVVAIESVNNAQGLPIQSVVIENDGQYTQSPDVQPFGKPLEEATAEEIVALVRRAGISGMGGATFPTYAKLQGAIGKAQTLIINCAECEPFITANHRLMLERPEEVLRGTEIFRHALGLERAIIAVEDNKMDAIEILRRKARAAELPIDVKAMKTKYPQGDERQLMFALLGKELPGGKLPADMGCVIFNAETTAAVAVAFDVGTPLLKRIVTVDGDCVKTPSNVLVHIGTSYSDLIDFCGGLCREPEKIVNGGPMMGFAQWDVNGSVTKGTSAILVFSHDFVRENEKPEASCIRCGRCVQNCPMHLMPNYLAQYSGERRYEEAEKLNVLSCVECGTCSYNCPGQIPIVQLIRVAKGAIRAEQARKKAAMAASQNIPQNKEKGEGKQ